MKWCACCRRADAVHPEAGGESTSTGGGEASVATEAEAVTPNSCHSLGTTAEYHQHRYGDYNFRQTFFFIEVVKSGL